jgi:hypothetical protein
MNNKHADTAKGTHAGGRYALDLNEVPTRPSRHKINNSQLANPSPLRLTSCAFLSANGSAS